MGRFDGRVALVTGGASGLGKSIAKRLAVDGARIVIGDVSVEEGEATARECDFTFLKQDVSDERRWAEVIEQIERRFGRLSILVNNAGILGSMDAATPENTSFQDWRRVFSINVDGVFLGCRMAIPALRRAGGGAIVNISSVAGLLATPYATAYGASKATVRHLTKSIAQHCAQQKLNIRCNSVHPGNVRSPSATQPASMWQRHIEQVAQQQGISVAQLVSDTEATIPLGDLTLPEDVAAAVAFLVSDEARHITGEQLIVDGGIVNCDTFRMSH
jgi:3(or 17)beta-hydroxysteroid dehydrogenase